MKKQLLTILLIVSLGSLTWGAQGTKSELFDLKKSRQELEVMKGILSTTIGFVASEMRGSDETRHVSARGVYRVSGLGTDVTAYYLYGQGATFIIPISSFRFESTGFGRAMAWSIEPRIAEYVRQGLDASLEQVQEQMNELNLDMAARNEEMADAAREAADAARILLREAVELPATAPSSGVVGGISGGVSGGVPGGVSGGVGAGSGQGRGAGSIQATPAPAARPAGPATVAVPQPPKTQIDKEEARRKLEQSQGKVRKAREEMEARRKKLLESLTQVSGSLVEALANHGDSLTHVKPNEYINIIITTDEGMPLIGDSGEGRSRREVISVQKSTITDYKAGRITLDAFKQKVLQYGT